MNTTQLYIVHKYFYFQHFYLQRLDKEPNAANSELFYKFVKSDVKIVKTVLENAGFIHTTGHD